jgi:hypothetical protein
VGEGQSFSRPSIKLLTAGSLGRTSPVLAFFIACFIGWGKRIPNCHRRRLNEYDVRKELDRLYSDVGIPQRLRDLSIPEDSIDLIAERSIETGQRLLANNPRVLSVEEAKELLRMAY